MMLHQGKPKVLKMKKEWLLMNQHLRLLDGVCGR